MITTFETAKENINKVTDEDVARAQRKICHENDGKTPKGSFVSYLQASKDRNFLQYATTDPYISHKFKVDMTKPITKEDAAIISSAVMKRDLGRIKKGSFAAIYQSCADRNEKHKQLGIPIESRVQTYGPNPMPKDIASEMQSKEAAKNKGIIAKDSLAALAQSAADRHIFQEKYYEREIEDIQESIVKMGFPTKKQAKHLESVTSKENEGAIPIRSTAATVQSMVDAEEASSSAEENLEPNVQNAAITDRSDVNKKRSHVPRAFNSF